MTSVRVLAPAKLNLGLAVLGKRPDGYHEIDTILAMIGLYDTITIAEIPNDGIEIIGMDSVPQGSNLMTKAAQAWSAAAGGPTQWRIQIDKRIPAPAGLGGASSDAASVLLALNALHDHRLSSNELHSIAASVGADCPFFLGPPMARARGIGTDLEPLPMASGWAMVAVPPSAVHAKTASLYAALRPEDFGSSTAIDSAEKDVRSMVQPPADFPNSFSRAASTVFPQMRYLTEAMQSVCGTWSLSGAGPAVYAIARDEHTVTAWASRLAEILPADISLHVAPLLTNRPEPELLP